MPEEKKEKFTFSDKIKSSKSAASKPAAKPAASKPFAKSSSKIGKDGKPRQTIFERTRRDAPFFIAALVALLLLPFLYKYSGQSAEEELMVPVSEENIFNPDHFGFDTAYTEDPDGQIAQLSGRDSLSLIRGLGSGEEDYGRDDLDFDASSAAAADYDYSAESDAEGKYAAAHHETSDMDVENNTTNIYKRRAKRGTRAAFRRATKIGSLNPASMRRAGGSGLGVKNWGGGLKNAAQKVKAPTPKEAPKPVSLQPLRAKSGRSSFGGTGKAGRKSREALGKADAQAALRDALVKPVDPTRVGGLDLFAMGPGGGNGRLERNINIAKGQEPWWWDMMKTRMQKEWEKNFERKWKWIDWADAIAMNILKGLINCLITGNSDGDVDNFLGKFGVNASVEPTCCGKAKKKIGALIQQQTGLPFGKEGCQNYQTFVGKDKCPDGWKDHSGAGAEVNMGFIGQRLCCLGFCGAGFKGAAAGSIDEGNGLPCADISNHRYHLDTHKLPRDWQLHTYIYVVARNYRPDNYPPLDKRAGRGFLCARDGIFNIGGQASGGADDVEVTALRNEKDEPNNFYKAHRNSVSHTKEQKTVADMYDMNREDVHDGCVIYIQRGNTFNYDNFQANMVQAFKKVLNAQGVKGKEAETRARDSFNNLDLMFIEGFASKYKLAYAKWFETGNNLHEILPMVYWRFYDTFVEHRKSTNKASGTRVKVDKRKMRVWGSDSAMGERCYFEDSMTAECVEEEKPQVIVRFNPRKYHGGGVLTDHYAVQESAKDIVVTAKFVPLNADNKFVGTEQPLDTRAPVLTEDGKGLIYTFTDVINKDKTGKETLGTGDAKIGKIIWSVDRKGNSDTQHMLTVTCPFNLSGDTPTPPVPQKKCQNAQESEECCLEINGPEYMWDDSKAPGSKCVKKPVDECPQGAETSEKCCKDAMGPGYLFDPNHNPKCYKPEAAKQTRLAPVISWVPSNGKTDCRENAGNEVNPPEGTFSKCPKVPGVVKNDTQKCGSQTPMMMDSSAAAKFVKDVVTAYNKALPAGAKPLSDKFYGGTYPTDGEFIDALFIAAENNLPGLQQVPAAAVCELGRDMVRMSRDPQVGSKQMKTYALGKRCPDSPYAYGQTGSQDKSTCYYTNDLGAFLAYVHPIAMFYPGVWVANNTTCDQRFIGIATNTGNGQACPNATVALNMHHNNYHSMLNKKKDAPDSSAVNPIWSVYSRSLNPSSLASNQPLAAVVSNKAWTDYALYTQCGTNGYKDKCTKAAMKYKKEIEPLLTEATSFQAWQGNACKGFYSGDNGPMVPVAKVLEYVKTVCSVGLDKKPHGIGSSRLGGSGTQSGGSHEGTGTSGTSNNPR